MDNNKELENTNGTIHYDENQIQVLEGLEAVRKRPGMYIGTTSQRGLHHLVYEIVDNSIDEAMAGRCDRIEVVLHPDGSVSVEDNGYGVPSRIHRQAGRPTLEVVFSVLHAGGKFGGSGYKISGGLHGVGASVVNALSEWMEVDNCYEGQRYTMRFEKGEIARPFACEGDSGGKHGLYVRFKPDPEIFTDTVEFDTDILLTRLREQAFLNAGIRIILRDERQLTEDEDDLLSKPFSMDADDPDIRRLLEAAAQASQSGEDKADAESNAENPPDQPAAEQTPAEEDSDEGDGDVTVEGVRFEDDRDEKIRRGRAVGSMEALFPTGPLALEAGPREETLALYCVRGRCVVSGGKACSRLRAGETLLARQSLPLLLEPEGGAPAALMLCRVRLCGTE